MTPAERRAWAFASPPAAARALLRGGTPPAEAPPAEAIARAVEAERAAEALGARIFALGEAEYPTLLATIADPPPLLYVRGDASALHRPSVAVIGTRQATADGLAAARAIAERASRDGFVVISGLALGIDGAAHLGALAAGGCTVAVLAHGLHTVSPAAHRDLAARILDTGGAWVSEHPPGVGARSHQFVQRDRLQSGLSAATILVESAAEGGAMKTVAFAHRQGRRIYAVLPVAPSSGLRRDGAERAIAAYGAVPVSSTAELQRQLSS